MKKQQFQNKKNKHLKVFIKRKSAVFQHSYKLINSCKMRFKGLDVFPVGFWLLAAAIAFFCKIKMFLRPF